jgi:poly(A) polymerase
MFKFYEVGGKIRDELLGIPSKDVDYVAVPSSSMGYTAQRTFEVLVDHLKKNAYQVFLETPSMFTVRAKFPIGHEHEGTVADFVMARKETGYREGTREPIVVIGTLEDDLQRRDFTINAMAKDENGKLIDPFNGIKDLIKKELKCPISPTQSFNDDPLRILRAIRFSIMKGFDMDYKMRYVIKTFDYYGKMHVVSEERIREELYKCFKYGTIRTLDVLAEYPMLRNYIFSKTKLWLKPTTEQ